MASRFCFGNFVFDARTGELKEEGGGATILRPKSSALLTYFLTHINLPLTREQLLTEIWEEEVVAGHNLTQSISEIRKALGDNGGEQTYIKTLPKKGYLWVYPDVRNEETAPLSPANKGGRASKASPRRFLMLLGFAAFLLLAAYWFFPFSKVSPSAGLNRPARVAVLPVFNATGNASMEWVHFGLMEMAVQYIRTPGYLAVSPPNEVIRVWTEAGYEQREQITVVELEEIARKMGLDAVLSMSLSAQKGALPYRVSLTWHPTGGAPTTREVSLRDPVATLGPLRQILVGQLSGSYTWPQPEEILPRDQFVNQTFVRGLHFQRMGQYLKAESFYQSAVTLAPDFLAAKLRLATCLNYQGRYDESASLLDEVLAHEASQRQPIFRIRALHDKASITLKKRDRKESICLLLEALDIAEKQNNIFAQASILTTLGGGWFDLEHLDDVRSYQLRALALAEQANMAHAMYANLNNLGNGYCKTKDMDMGLYLYEAAYPYCLASGNETELASLMTNIAQVHFERDELELAAQMCLDALAIQRENGDKLAEANTLTNLGFVYRKDQNWEKARKYFYDSLAAFQAMDHPGGCMDSHYQLGLCYRAGGQEAYAKQHFKRALTLAEGVGHSGMIQTLQSVLNEAPVETTVGL